MSSPSLVVGMPVYRRAWVLGEWFDSLLTQRPPEDVHLVFGLSPSPDGTENLIYRRCRELNYSFEVLDVDLPTFEEDEKDAPGRYAVLAHVRNVLLRRVAALSPAAYLSWDSDILLEPDALWELRSVLDRDEVDAAGALVDMGGDVYPGHLSMMALEGDDAFRYDDLDVGQLILEQRPRRVGVIMGVKLLSPEAYRNARYADHVLGEDVGWALQARAMGLGLWIVPKARGIHRYRITSVKSP